MKDIFLIRISIIRTPSLLIINSRTY